MRAATLRLGRIALICLLLGLTGATSSETAPDTAPEAEPETADTRGQPRAGLQRTSPRSEPLPGLDDLPAVAAGPPGSPERRDSWSAYVRAAMLSAYYYADRERRELPWKPIPLLDAARILVQDAERSSFGESRRRRVVQKLIVGGLELGDDLTHSHRYRDALVVLLEEPGRSGETLLGEIDVQIERAIKEFFSGSFVGAGIPIELLRRIAALLSELLYASAPAIGGCAAVAAPDTEIKDPSAASSTCGHLGEGWKTSLVWAETTLAVKRDLEEVAVALDPQNWDAWDAVEGERCSPWFAEVLVVEAPAWSQLSCPPTPGLDWSGHLYEEFVLDWVLVNSAFFNVLEVDSEREPDPDPTEHIYDFCLESYLGGWVGSDEGAIAVDEGFSKVFQGAGGWVDLAAEKKISFIGWLDDAGMQVAAELLLENMGDAHAEQACCRPPPPPTCSPTGP